MEDVELKRAVEALLFITDHPLSVPRLCHILGDKDRAKIAGIIGELQREYESRGSGPRIFEIAEGFQCATRAEHAPYIRKLFADKMTLRLSTAALETLSIIAYKQPLTRAEIEEIRGVEVIAALETLLDKRLIKVAGRKETVGRPLLYGTTPEFLRHFGLKSLEELPPIGSFQAAADPRPAEPASPTPAAEFAAGPISVGERPTEPYGEGTPHPGSAGERPTEPEP